MQMKTILQRLLISLGLALLATSVFAAANPMKDPKYCGSCHQRIYKEWAGSRMGTDLDNPIVYQFYTGTNPAGKKDGLGFQPFTHGKKGDCADCHVPELVLDEHAEGREVDLGIAMKEKLDHGISCNFCHTVSDVKLEKDANGRYHTRIFETVTRDQSGPKYGPLKDAKSPVHATKYSALHKDSKLCGACHLNQENFLSISTYDDWKTAFETGKTDQTCQGCHMPLIEGEVQVAVGGPKRSGMRAHTFIGANDAGMLRKALDLQVGTQVADGKLIVSTTVENVGAGHKVPGSGPIRNVILKVDVLDANGKPLKYVGDKRGRLPPLAGFGNPKTKKRDANDWAGMPGKMYAKVYRSKPIPKMGNKPMVGVGGFAAEAVVFDTTLKPREPDHSKFIFALPKGGTKGISVKARLVYRGAFKPLSDRKGWKLDQREMTMVKTSIK